jgi:hypothetical protein
MQPGSTNHSPRFHNQFAPQKPFRLRLTRQAQTGKIHTIRKSFPPMTAICKHPIVKVVAREEDAEFVECQNCGEVFDSAEFSDIAIEEEQALADPPKEN